MVSRCKVVVVECILMVAICMVAVIGTASAGFISVRAGGDNNIQIMIDGKEIPIFPDGTSPTVMTKDTTVITVKSPEGIYEEKIITRGNTVYQTGRGARVSPMGTQTGQNVPLDPIETPSPPAPTPTPVVHENNGQGTVGNENASSHTGKPVKNK